MSEEKDKKGIDTSRDAIEDVEKTVEELKKRIQELSEAAQEEDDKSDNSSVEETKTKIAEIRDNAVKTVTKSIEDVRAAAVEKTSNEELKKTMEFIRENAKKAVENAKSKITEIKNDSNFQKGVIDAKEFADDVFSKAKSAADSTASYVDSKLSEEQKSKLVDLKEKTDQTLIKTSENLSNVVEQVRSNPDVQKAAQKGKELTEKSINAVKDIVNKKDKESDE